MVLEFLAASAITSICLHRIGKAIIDEYVFKTALKKTGEAVAGQSGEIGDALKEIASEWNALGAGKWIKRVNTSRKVLNYVALSGAFAATWYAATLGSLPISGCIVGTIIGIYLVSNRLVEGLRKLNIIDQTQEFVETGGIGRSANTLTNALREEVRKHTNTLNGEGEVVEVESEVINPNSNSSEMEAE